MAHNRDREILFAAFAVQMGFVTTRGVVECGEAVAQDPDRGLADELVEKGYLSPEDRRAVEERVREAGDAADDPMESISLLGLDEDTRISLLNLAPDPGAKTVTVKGEAALRGFDRPAGERYRPEAEIGRGALGRVLAARDAVLGREVAIKEMIKGTDSPRLLERFLREGKIAGRLSHPNVIPVLDIGVREDDSGAGLRPYIVMTRIQGRDLMEIIKAVERGTWEWVEGEGSRVQSPEGEGNADARSLDPSPSTLHPSHDPRKHFSRPRLLRVFQEVCLAMAYAHDQGVIHRDLKPANIMVGEYGEVYVVDWGLSKVLSDSPDGATDQENQPAREQEARAHQVDQGSMTMDGEILGTPAYMPPEQAEGRMSEVDERSDIYSLGAVLYEILTFHPPFEGGSGLHVLAQVLRAPLMPPSVRASQVRKSFEPENAEGEADNAEIIKGYVKPEYLHSEITSKILKCYFEVYRTLGPGHLEKVYETALLSELRNVFDDVKAHELLTVHYKDIIAGEYCADIVVEGKVLLELKAVRTLAPVHEAQLVNYLKATGIEVGLLLNFGGDQHQIKRRIYTGDHLQRPSEVLQRSQVRKSLPEVIPPELEEIVLKAMSRGKEDRYASAREIHEDVQKYLEGEKERERRKQEAEERVLEGEKNLARFRALAGEIREAQEEVRRIKADVPTWAPLEKRRGLWEAEDRVKALREKRMAEFGRAEVAFGAAILADPDNPEGTDGRCSLYFERFLAAEKRRDADEVALYRNLLKAYDEKRKWIRRIEKPGTLSLLTFRYRCSCLAPVKEKGWGVRFGEVVDVPFRDGRPVHGEELKRHDRPIPEITVFSGEGSGFARLGHGPRCPREPVKGVEVTAFRYEERDRRLQPGKGVPLGRTPLKNVTLEQGSYICLLQHPDFTELRLPVRIDRGGRWEQEVNLVGPGELPEGFRFVPGGPFLWSGESRKEGALEELEVQDFLIARTPVTLGEYIEFLDALSADDPEEARKRAPREADQKFLVEEGVRWRVPKEGEPDPFGLRPGHPLFGISWFDALEYCAWLSGREGRLYTLPHEEEWEKAARGVDGRRFPWGDSYEWTFSNTIHSSEEGAQLKEAGSFEADVSPYGVLDMAGNMATWCLNGPGEGFSDDRLLRGGAWCFSWDRAQTHARMGLDPLNAHRHTGLRLVLRPRGAF